MAYELLSEPIRKYIREQGWTALRPIQSAAISRILTTDFHYILASRTASGKTEAAFLPILSTVDFNEIGVQVLYISPLVALINDQFRRIEDLCKNLDIPVTKWHGEAKRSLKNRLIKKPSGIVLITPESLEAMFVNKSYQVNHLFSNLKFVVIDEIHSFIGADRGIQLKSILSRLQQIQQEPFRVVGLSATIGDYNEAKAFTGDAQHTKVLLDKTQKPVHIAFKYFEGGQSELPLSLLKDLYLNTKDHKALIFPNSRGRVEEVAVKLLKISERVGGHRNYFSHHSSVHKEVREYIEFFAKNNQYQNFSIACTSTLELGIDIGSVDEVVQIDATQSVASLIQRIGRSGRKDGQRGRLFLYATTPWSLLQSLACWQLHQEGVIEPPSVTTQPFDILAHQILSIVKGNAGLPIIELKNQIIRNTTFAKITSKSVDEIIAHLIEKDYLERLRHEVIIGIEGEKIVNSRDFYSVFSTDIAFKFIHKNRTIGEVPFTPQIREGENILLAARIWTINEIDFKAKKIFVQPAKDGKKPSFLGGVSDIAPIIREKMLSLLYENQSFDFLDEASQDRLNNLRKEFSIFQIEPSSYQRPAQIYFDRIRLMTFTGSRIQRTLSLLLEIKGFKSQSINGLGIEITEFPKPFLLSQQTVGQPLADIDRHIEALLEKNPALASFSKWSKLLPLKYQVQLLKQRYFDIEGTTNFLEKVEWVQS